MLQPHQAYSSGSLAPNGELVTKLMALRPGGALTLIGLGQAQLSEVLSRSSSAPRRLRLDVVGIATTALAIDRILTIWRTWLRPCGRIGMVPSRRSCCRGLKLTLEDAGWAWTATHLSAALPPTQRTLSDVLARLGEHLARTPTDG